VTLGDPRAEPVRRLRKLTCQLMWSLAEPARRGRLLAPGRRCRCACRSPGELWPVSRALLRSVSVSALRSDVDSISLTLTVVDWSSEVKHFPHHRAKSLIYQARAPLSALCDVGGLRGSGALQRSLLPSCYQSLGELLVI
jgi:hypothetical protein